MDAEIIPKFRPDEKNCNVITWLHKIDQLGDVYGWDNRDRQFVMQIRLRGSARDWYDDLEDYDLSWNEWKDALRTAFPRSTDFVDRLEEMLARTKSESETMTKYFHTKMALLKRCQIQGEDAISCIIRGLPQEIRANAKAFKCSTPQQLYFGYLSSLENYKTVVATATSSKSVWRRGNIQAITSTTTSSLTARQQPLPKICYACRRPGHEARECRSLLRCGTCQRTGHATANCWFGAYSSQQQGKVSRILHITYKIFQDLYKKVVHVNGYQLIAYIDTGSQLNIITAKQASKLKLILSPSVTFMKGFGGLCARSLGTAKICVTIDGLCISGDVEVTDCNLSDIDLIVGQPMINQDNVSLVTTPNCVTFLPTFSLTDLLSNIQLENIDYVNKFPVYLKQNVKIPKQSHAYIEVVVGNINSDNNIAYLSNEVYFELGCSAYLIPQAVIAANHNILKVFNVGYENIIWSANRLITRAELIDKGEINNNNVYTINNITSVETNTININDIDVGDLNEHDQHCLLNLLNRFNSSFTRNSKDLGCTDLIEMHIHTTTDQPVYFKPYRLSHKESEIVNDKVQDLLDAGIVRESRSDYASPVVLVRKKNGDYRLCVDYRALNARTVKDRFPLPHIEDQVTKLSGKMYFTTLDLAQGYHQVPVAGDSISKTAFITPSGQYEYVKMPFGLANAPAVFARLMKMVLGKLNENIAVYLDDVMLPTISVTAGLDLLEEVLQLLTDANLKLNLSKCSFLKKSANYLGHEITAGTIQPGHAKINCVAQYKRPRNVHEVRQFIGLASYFRKFVRNFAEIARPITELTKKNSAWVWGDKQEHAFQVLKQKLTERPVLGIYNKDAKTELHTDASRLGLGGILMQYQDDGNLKPIAYFSRVTSKEESFYHSYELETLAVVESLKRFRIYLVGIPVKIITDCAALRTTLTKKDLIPRIARWWLTIQDFDLQIEYRPGSRMKHVDALSRNPMCGNILMIDNSDWLLTLQMQDENIQNLLTQLRAETSNRDIVSNYCIKDDVLYRKTVAGDRFVIPKLGKYGLLQKYHDQVGHPGFDRCEKSIKEQFWFSGMTRFIRKYINSCLQCAYAKGNYGRTEGELHPIRKEPIPMHTLHADHLGPFVKTRKGNVYVLVVIDSFTKFVFAKPAKTCNSVETISLLKDVINQFGNPKRIITDRGKAFTSRYFKQFAEESQFKHVLNAIASPRSNGQVERVNRTLLDGLNTMSESECTWDEKLADVVWGINNTYNATTGFSPFKLMFGHENSRLSGYRINDEGNAESQQQELERRRETAKLRIDRNMTQMKDRFDRKHKKCIKYNQGQLVLWKGGIARDNTARVTKKLSGLYTGPYKICKTDHSIDRYTIISIKGMKGYKKFSAVVPGESLRPYNANMSDNNDSSGSDHDIDRDDLIDLLES